MKKQWLSIMAVVLTAIAASPKVFPVVANLASGVLSESGKPQTEANSPQAPPEEEWVIEAADWREVKKFGLGSDRGLRADAAGNPHIAYGGTHLYYAWYDGVDWQYEIADSTAMVGYGASLALDADANPYIAYRDSGNSDIKYAYRDGSGWHTEIVDLRGGGNISLALDEEGYGHISFVIQDSLIYAYQDDSGWYTRTVDSHTASDRYWGGINSLAMDEDGYPHIGYYAVFIDPDAVIERQNLRYAYQDATGWYTQTVDSSGRVGNHPSLALDSAGRPHISYRDMDHQSLKYAYLDATGWYSVTVDSRATVCYFTSLDLDSQDQPRIVYNSDSPEELKYAGLDGSDWDIQTVPIEGNPACSPSSIAIADNGDVHVVYYDWSSGYLRYAYYDEIDWQTVRVDYETDSLETGAYSSLALDQDGYPHIGYYNTKYGSLKHRYKTSPRTWVSDNPRYSPADVGRYTSLAIDGYGYAHVSAYDATNKDLAYAYQDACRWNEVTLKTTNVDDGLYTSLDVTDGGEAYISYYDARFGDLYIAHFNQADYDTDKLDDTGDVGKYASLTLDASGNFHISYYDSTNGNLKYLRAGQTIQVVDSVGDVELYSSIDTDGSENPHISYSGNGLQYAYYDGSEWYTETVDTAGLYSSIVIDEYDNPHISYYDQVNGDLKYAHKEAGTWYLQVVDDYDDVGQYTSIDLDDDGNPRMSYYDVTNKGLKYAYAGDLPWWEQAVAVFLPVVSRNPAPPASAPVLGDISNPDGDGDYTVSWSTVERATGYTLHEDDDPGFSSPTTRYTGPRTTTSICGNSIGTYYYRVKASNGLGSSDWSETRAATVTTEPPAPPPCADPGAWSGSNNQGFPIEFSVTSGCRVTDLTLEYLVTCQAGFMWKKKTFDYSTSISDDSFEFDDDGDPTVSGHFTSLTRASGSWSSSFYLPGVGACSGSGTWSADGP